MKRTYQTLRSLKTIQERFVYLRLNGEVGKVTFGYDRWLNQKFYKTKRWKEVREHVLIRDLGCDLGIPGYEIRAKALIHHMNPVIVDDIKYGNLDILDPEYLITTSFLTHQGIHYGNKLILLNQPTERKPGDTLLWRREKGV